MSDFIIVSQHAATQEFLRCVPGLEDAPIISGNATATDVEGKVVVGNLPLHLASKAKLMIAVEFTGTPPRGRDYTAGDMINANAVLRAYVVTSVPINELK
jgi:hypothetical protein